jgi:hypothetical protein
VRYLLCFCAYFYPSGNADVRPEDVCQHPGRILPVPASWHRLGANSHHLESTAVFFLPSITPPASTHPHPSTQKSKNSTLSCFVFKGKKAELEQPVVFLSFARPADLRNLVSTTTHLFVCGATRRPFFAFDPAQTFGRGASLQLSTGQVLSLFAFLPKLRSYLTLFLSQNFHPSKHYSLLSSIVVSQHLRAFQTPTILDSPSAALFHSIELSAPTTDRRILWGLVSRGWIPG